MRSAIIRLTGEGLVERLANGTLVIREVPLDELLQIMIVRHQIESEAAAQAAHKADLAETQAMIRETEAFLAAPESELEPFWAYDDRFHSFVAESARMPYLAGLIRNVREKARMCHVVRMELNFADQAREHMIVLEAIGARDANAARQAMIEHTEKVRARFLRWYAG